MKIGVRKLSGSVRKLTRKDKLQQVVNLGRGANIDGTFVSVEAAKVELKK